MTREEKEKITEIVCYILNKTGGVDVYHLLKIVYFSELKHLRKWGRRITTDDICALDYGPVPSKLYDGINKKDKEFNEMLQGVFSFASQEARSIMLPKRQPDLDWLSKSEIDALDESIEENAQSTFSQLMNKSHDEIWKKHFEHGKGMKKIPTEDLAVSAQADAAMTEYIRNNIALDKMLICA